MEKASFFRYNFYHALRNLAAVLYKILLSEKLVNKILFCILQEFFQNLSGELFNYSPSFGLPLHARYLCLSLFLSPCLFIRTTDTMLFECW